ncbi:hypothetical protein ACFSJY_12665 [Thalassotalea euphylliae]|uniref:hypothetical protein n=1 Tax=Thalassotalea euphylliae TaxID=1655234 RepID=UPI0036376444
MIGIMRPHGTVALTWRRNILLNYTQGPFNVEGVKRSFDDIKQSVAEAGFDHWYRVDFLDEETLGCPEVMKVIGDSYKWSSVENNCGGVLVCCSNQLQQNMMHRFISHTALNIQVFSSSEAVFNYIENSNWSLT